MRYQLPDATIMDFGHEFLVVCPQCGKRARVDPGAEGGKPRLTCPSCGRIQDWKQTTPGICFTAQVARYEDGMVCVGDAVDWYFHLPLWMSAPCCGHILWTYNLKHLDFLEDFVRATLRERTHNEHGWSNQSLRTRLPEWMQAANNRETILKCIARLREKAERDTP